MSRHATRFIAEHYGTPWDSGQMAGSRTVTSNPVHSFFWNNINWHIGHHVCPSVPWYNLVELHRLLEADIATSGAVVDRSYLAVYGNALRHGPESEPRLAAALAARRVAAAATTRDCQPGRARRTGRPSQTNGFAARCSSASGNCSARNDSPCSSTK